ncbi:MAG: hypothetical protein HY289_08285 [Planctomycetes bacterium]|nr:hypothetical protein [Planctomycetota bacterium]
MTQSNIDNLIQQRIPHQRGGAATVPIGIRCGETLRHFGTGTLLRIADESFLVTASHVFSMARQSDLYFSDASGTPAILLGGDLASTDHYFDVAVIAINEAAADNLKNKSFLRVGDITFAPPRSGDIFTAFGFPSVMSFTTGSRMGLGAMQITSQLYEGDTTRLLDFHPECHFCLMADPDQTQDELGNHANVRSRSGHVLEFPRDLGGISGCGVWQIGNLNTMHEEQSEPRLVGVQTGVYSDCIKVTRWGIVARMIEESMPQLKNALRLVREL